MTGSARSRQNQQRHHQSVWARVNARTMAQQKTWYMSSIAETKHPSRKLANPKAKMQFQQEREKGGEVARCGPKQTERKGSLSEGERFWGMGFDLR